MDERLIEVNFPLQQTSLDSVHEKTVHYGHISTLHIWPARRPLAASRATLITTLLPDPGTTRERKDLLYKLAGREVTRTKPQKRANGKTEEQTKEETEDGILHWGRETSEDLNWFREKIREAYGGRAPRVLDPFAGGGAIPLEAMRLGCEVTAVDINPVAWFILKCTLEYPQKLAGQYRPLPEFVVQSREFMEEYLKAKGLKGANLKKQLALFGFHDEEKQAASQSELLSLPEEKVSIEADLAWHVRAWGWWVLQQAKAELERFYPTIDDKPTVAYLWARTVICKNCRATIPLLKTRWLCKNKKKRVVLTMEPNTEKTGVIFGVQDDVPVSKGTVAQRREHDKRIGGGTMSGTGTTCPCCGTIMKMEDIRLEARAGRLGVRMTSVVVDGENGKEYRLPIEAEICLATEAEKEVSKVFAEIPFGLPEEPTPKGGSGASRAFSVDGYGFDKWYKLFTSRQLLALGTFVKYTRAVREVMRIQGYMNEWVEAVEMYLACNLSKTVHLGCTLCTWHQGNQQIRQVFARYALPITWDFAESMPSGESCGSYLSMLESTEKSIATLLRAISNEYSILPHVTQSSATQITAEELDAIVTDPPYYDAIPYSDLMDFFYIWLRRILYTLSPDIDATFKQPTSPKWNHEYNDGELIDDSSRFDGNKQQSKKNYEDGMARVFQKCYKMLAPDGRLVVVFAHKHPDAWETLVSAIIRAGFVVTASWPIQTEMGSRTRALSAAALASSIWLVCKKRPEGARDGWDSKVLGEMRTNIVEKLHNFWDAEIRGPDFVWAATGPALEAYSKHPLVKKSNQPGQLLSVKEFLNQARRNVLDFVVGQVLHDDQREVSSLDTVTIYYLLHRFYFGTESVPIGPCILYAVSCGLSDHDLINRYDMLARSGGLAAKEEDEEEGEAHEDEGEEEEGTSSAVRLKQWYQRKGSSLGYGTPSVPVPPLIDQLHRLMHLWQAGEESKLSDYLERQGLEQNAHFPQLLQALIELQGVNSEERGILERISNYVKQRKGVQNYRLELL